MTTIYELLLAAPDAASAAKSLFGDHQTAKPSIQDHAAVVLGSIVMAAKKSCARPGDLERVLHFWPNASIAELLVMTRCVCEGSNSQDARFGQALAIIRAYLVSFNDQLDRPVGCGVFDGAFGAEAQVEGADVL